MAYIMVKVHFTFSDGATYVGKFENGKESGVRYYLPAGYMVQFILVNLKTE